MSKLLTPDEAAKYLGIAKVTLYGMKYKKKIPYRKVGKLLRFDEDDLEKWTRRHELAGIKKFFAGS
jgi:excisionase family DNA binding protein